ncbi:esterase-like activity of phytase family protein [Polaribacter sp.]|uniref:esterase-like activity of phytase family protein n=1 Tax=Polaribacter sp. TaxID=1920175 RepID=UPI003F6A6675
MIYLKKIFIFFVSIASLLACKKEKNISLKYLDEYILKDSIFFKGTLIGGLSGIDFANDSYFFVVDDGEKPRFLRAKINIDNKQITNIEFKDLHQLNDTTNNFYKTNYLDLESIFVDKQTKEINFVSEGSINYNKPPLVFKTDSLGKFIKQYSLPKAFLDTKNMKHNATLEASSKSADGKGFWVAMEGVLKSDGEEPSFTETYSPIRITYYDKQQENATKQFAYQLEKITKPAKGNINLNGVTAILEYENNKFFVVERTYQNGYGAYGNIIRVFKAEVTEETTNCITIDALKNSNVIPLKKTLVFNFETIKNKLTDGIIDNIEGITFGPTLKNGHKTLLFVSDDNFQKYGKQLNQFILLEITDK